LGDSQEYRLGDLGKVYGAQWRNQNGVDQVKDVVDGLRDNPYSRYHIIDGWNKADFPEMALPPCHLLYQFIVRPMSFEERSSWASWQFDNLKEWTVEEMDERGVPTFYLDLNMYQRSCDTFLGVPFNIASMSLLLMIMARVSGMVAGVANWIGGDTHMYVSHRDAVNEQLSRTPTELPFVTFKKDFKTLKDIENLTLDDIELNEYNHQGKIKAELFTGLKKK
jgi:thymidylate synthase